MLFCTLHSISFYDTPLFYAEPKSLAYAEWPCNLLHGRKCGSIITTQIRRANYPGYSIPLLRSNPKNRTASGPGDAQLFEKARVSSPIQSGLRSGMYLRRTCSFGVSPSQIRPSMDCGRQSLLVVRAPQPKPRCHDDRPHLGSAKLGRGRALE
jgi:hypothetical protein